MLALAAEPSRISGVVRSTAEPHVCAPIDANGNLTADGAKTYYWNALNQLVEVKEGSTTIATFEYDGAGRRTEKVAAGLTHQYVYDAEDIVEERISGSTSDTIRYHHGVGIDEPLARTNGSSVTTYYLADHLGSIVQETNASGTVTLEREYGPWGDLLSGTSTSGYAFQGREWDAEIALYYFRARYYNAASGTWASDDPIGFAGGLNFSQFVGNNPVRFVDPFGLCQSGPNGQQPYDPKVSGPEDPTRPGQPLHQNPVVKQAMDEAWRKTANGTARNGNAEAGFTVQHKDGVISVANKRDTVHESGKPNEITFPIDSNTIAVVHTHGNALTRTPSTGDVQSRLPNYVVSQGNLYVTNPETKTYIRLPK